MSEDCKAENIELFVCHQGTGGDPEAIERCSMDIVDSYVAGMHEQMHPTKIAFKWQLCVVESSAVTVRSWPDSDVSLSNSRSR